MIYVTKFNHRILTIFVKSKHLMIEDIEYKDPLNSHLDNESNWWKSWVKVLLIRLTRYVNSRALDIEYEIDSSDEDINTTENEE